jgi:hypothetical protein
MLSGLLAPPEPEAASGGFIIGALLSGGAVFLVCANAVVLVVATVNAANVANVANVADAMPAVRVVHLLRFMSFSCAMLVGCSFCRDCV